MLPVKKSVTLSWNGQSLIFDVAQDLFSSYQVDRGSRMLLDSLDQLAVADQGRAVDFGCGYGVLGVAWQAANPGWTMHYVDRDALAVAFSRHNLARNMPELMKRAMFACDISLTPLASGYDLVLWNVPGKAGAQVVAGLTDVILDALVPGGTLAAVVVHPLIDVVGDAAKRSDTELTWQAQGPDHSVLHIRRTTGDVRARDPFREGLFDRAAETFACDGLEWTLVPVIGLPEYDELDRSTILAIRQLSALAATKDVARWADVGSGVGHEAMAAALLWPAATGLVRSRDALAVRVTTRAVSKAHALDAAVEWGFGTVQLDAPVDLMIVKLAQQVPEAELAELLGYAISLVTPGGTIVLHGRATEVARLERIVRRVSDMRSRGPVKVKGSAAIVVTRVSRP